jgi:hypothetical protein
MFCVQQYLCGVSLELDAQPGSKENFGTYQTHVDVQYHQQ